MLILDTSVLCVWLKVPGKETCGSGKTCLDFETVNGQIKSAIELQYTLVLPLASILETGNHITHAREYRHERATALAELMIKAADEASPWAAFSDQQTLWVPEGLKKLAQAWPDLAARKLSIGDATITQVADYYTQMGFLVQIFTGDQGLQEHHPTQPSVQPRRRR